MTKSLMVTLAELILCGETFRRTKVTAKLQDLELGKHTERLSDCEKQDFLSGKTKVELLRLSSKRKPGTAHCLHNIIPPVKHDGGSICSCAQGLRLDRRSFQQDHDPEGTAKRSGVVQPELGLEPNETSLSKIYLKINI